MDISNYIFGFRTGLAGAGRHSIDADSARTRRPLTDVEFLRTVGTVITGDVAVGSEHRAALLASLSRESRNLTMRHQAEYFRRNDKRAHRFVIAYNPSGTVVCTGATRQACVADAPQWVDGDVVFGEPHTRGIESALALYAATEAAYLYAKWAGGHASAAQFELKDNTVRLVDHGVHAFGVDRGQA